MKVLTETVICSLSGAVKKSKSVSFRLGHHLPVGHQVCQSKKKRSARRRAAINRSKGLIHKDGQGWMYPQENL